MDEKISDIVEILESLLEGMAFKPKEELQKVIIKLKVDNLDSEDLIKVQDDLEIISSMSSLDSFSRNEIINLITEIETIFNY